MTAPALLAPLLGYVVDRVPRRTFLVVAEPRCPPLMMLPLLLVHDAGDVWIVYAVAFCYGISFVVVPAALNGLLKDMLAEDVLVEANASLGVTREALRLVGPLIGAATFALVGGGAVAMVGRASPSWSRPRRSPGCACGRPARRRPRRAAALAGRGGRGRAPSSAGRRCSCTPRSRSAWPCW